MSFSPATSTETNPPTYAGLTDPGRVRQQNQDCWVADLKQGSYIVSDGVAGGFAGDLAAKYVVEALPRLLQQRLHQFVGSIEAFPLQDVIVELSNCLRSKAENQPGLDGMGATVVVALIQQSQALIGHLGDSRAYLWRQGTLQQLTKDHALVQLLLDCGEVTSEEAVSHPSRSQLTRYVGMGEPVLPEIQFVQLQPGDHLLLCSDGLTNMLKDDELLTILNQEGTLQEACQALIDSANVAGGRDNITALLTRQ
ncbi:MAG: protein phosphatase 2C domain-containing protein [Phormidesmis sp. CAN_BIN44]|nr:protein phosphatase 2C domain-containing protein [Phormidesmis sp. CAN_BIN44]